MTSKITFSPYPNDVTVLERIAKEKGYSVAFLVREVLGNWCADQRRDKRVLRMPALHYTARNMDDYSEVE